MSDLHINTDNKIIEDKLIKLLEEEISSYRTPAGRYMSYIYSIRCLLNKLIRYNISDRNIKNGRGTLDILNDQERYIYDIYLEKFAKSLIDLLQNDYLYIRSDQDNNMEIYTKNELIEKYPNEYYLFGIDNMYEPLSNTYGLIKFRKMKDEYKNMIEDIKIKLPKILFHVNNNIELNKKSIIEKLLIIFGISI